MITKAHQIAISHFLSHCAQYTDIQPYHTQWVRQHAHYKRYPRHTCIYDPYWQQEQVFYICSGLVARVNSDIDRMTLKSKPSILSVGLPRMALMTTDHLFSRTQATGEIIALRNSEILTISYEQIKRSMRDDHSLDSMMAALNNKKKRQLARLRQIDMVRDPQSRYIRFADILPELRDLLSQTEQAQLLGIGRKTVNRASYFLLTGRNKR